MHTLQNSNRILSFKKKEKSASEAKKSNFYYSKTTVTINKKSFSVWPAKPRILGLALLVHQLALGDPKNAGLWQPLEKVLRTCGDFLPLVLDAIDRISKGKPMYFPRSVISGLRPEIAGSYNVFINLKARNSAHIKTIEGWGSLFGKYTLFRNILDISCLEHVCRISGERPPSE